MNVIFIMNDSFRWDHLGCHGNPAIHTPYLDGFAGEAALFERCVIASYPTVPNRWDLLTGRYGFPFRGWQPLSPEDVTLAQILAGNGVHTQMIWDTPMLGSYDFNYSRGFKGLWFVRGQKGDAWVTDPALPIRQPAQPHKIKNADSLATYLRNHYHRRHEREYCVGRTVSAAMDWLETNHSHDAFFLWIDMWDPHEPFDCPWYDYARYADPEYAGDRMIYPQYGRPSYMSSRELQDARALYAGNVTLVDRWVGRLLETVEKLGLLRNTLIIWTTDHGHLFGEHDLQGKPGAELGKLYEVTTRIPLLVRHPDGLGSGHRIRALVQPVDIMPSVLQFMGIAVPESVQGRSFWPLLKGDAAVIREYAFSSRFPPGAADESYRPVEGALYDGWVGSDRIVEPSTVTGNKWTYLCAPQGMASELYDLENDPEQTNNVVAQHPEVAQAMRRQWIDFLKSHGAPESRIRPFVRGNVGPSMPPENELFAFRDDLGQWIAFRTKRQAEQAARRDDAPGPRRRVDEIPFGAVLEDDPKNLIHMYDQYYWAEDLA